MPMANNSANTSSTALKALNVLETVAFSSQPISVTEAAEQVGIDKGTAYRMLKTLVDARYVTQDEISKRYRLSYKVISLSRNLLADNEVTELIRQRLERITDETHETLHLSVLDGHRTVIVLKVKGTQLVTVDFQIGDRESLHCTSIGKVLLAFQDIRYIEAFVAAGLPKMASNTITDPDEFRRELQLIRSQGYATDDHEFSDSMRCIAVPIFESGGRVHRGISISGPDSRFSFEKLEELKEPLLKASRELSEQLGGITWTR
jgi:IclR family KDG regulon transcriptional repressor